MRAVAYVDGSFMTTQEGKGIYGSGVLLILEGQDVPMEFSFGGDDPQFVKMRNVAGEIMACTNLVKFLEDNFPAVDWLDLYYDYEGIEKWVTGAWRAKMTETMAYQTVMREAQKRMRIKFFKVQAHAGNIYNERADGLAKRGVREKASELGLTL